jgi:hypothetical protein
MASRAFVFFPASGEVVGPWRPEWRPFSLMSPNLWFAARRAFEHCWRLSAVRCLRSRGRKLQTTQTIRTVRSRIIFVDPTPPTDQSALNQPGSWTHIPFQALVRTCNHFHYVNLRRVVSYGEDVNGGRWHRRTMRDGCSHSRQRERGAKSRFGKNWGIF